jgi:ribosome-associated translation inhibitor RaiA
MSDVQIAFHGVDRSNAVVNLIQDSAAKLAKFADGITSCKVTVERPAGSHRHGNSYSVRVDVHVAGAPIVAEHEHEDLRVALHEAFSAARRRLQDHVRIRQGR